MHATRVSAASLLALVSSVQAAGHAIVNNQCAFPVYLWSVSNTGGNMIKVNSDGGSYSEAYRTNSNGGGISIKIATEQDVSGPITQFEYTLGSDFIWYDVSNINGYPFMKSGLTAIPSSKTCTTVVCPAGIEKCAAAYNIPSDNHATAACKPDSDITLVLCSNQQGTGANSAASSLVASKTSTGLPFDFTPVSLLGNNVVKAPAAATKAAKLLTEADVAAVAAVANKVVSSNAANRAVFTTFVTQYVTIEERAAAPTAASAPRKERRHSHHHNHRQEHHA